MDARTLGEALEEVQYGAHHHLGLSARVAQCLAHEASALPAGPTSFFVLDGCAGEAGGGIDCPSLPLPPPQAGPSLSAPNDDDVRW
jgi:hypothetical protein